MADKNPLVGIIMGSDSDLSVMKEAADALEDFGVPFEINVYSAHRSPNKTREYLEAARGRGIRVIIASAGMAAHLAGVSAAHTTMPVIGVPIGKTLDGMDSLLSTVQMPPGIPVATVGIDSGKNAGILAVQILATSDDSLTDKLTEFKKDLEAGVLKKNEKLTKLGYKKYLEEVKK